MNLDLLAFLKEHYNILIYLLTWLIAVYRYRTYFDTVLKYFPILIMYTFLTELLGYFIKYHEEFQFFSDDRYSWRNVIIYNIYQIVCFLFFYWVYWKTLTNKRHRKWLMYGIVLSMLSQLVSIFFQNPFHMHLYYANIIGSLVLILAIVLYFKEKWRKTNSYSKRHNLLFWVSMGLFVFYVFFPFILLVGYVRYDLYAEYHFRTALLALILFMYGCFNIGLLVGKRRAFG